MLSFWCWTAYRVIFIYIMLFLILIWRSPTIGLGGFDGFVVLIIVLNLDVVFDKNMFFSTFSLNVAFLMKQNILGAMKLGILNVLNIWNTFMTVELVCCFAS